MTAQPKTENLPAAAPKASLATGGKIAALVPTDIEQAFRLSKAIAIAGFAPKSYGTDENKIMVGILHGMEVGLTPIAALQSIAVINGAPQIWGDGALGLVRSSGLLVDFEETITGEGDNAVATCRCVRKEQSSPVVRSFSMKDAIAAGLKGKAGPWSQYPKRMLQMRARSWALRDGFADVLRGLSIREEAQDMGTLVDNGDGSYNAPPRPTREDYQQPAEPERQVEEDPTPAGPVFQLVNAWGEKEGQPTTDQDEYLQALGDQFKTAAAARDAVMVESLAEYNADSISMLLEAARDNLDRSIKETLAAIAEAKKPAPDKPAQQQRKSAGTVI